jgi:2,4-dienoyl-CoA reductase-like NADH-dependent reductase (Old Yellow Enzyme family)
MMSQLFKSLQIRELQFKNRIFVSPMCQYASEEGKATHWHLVHLGSRAVGGAALILVEATAVAPEGRISPHDSGIWSGEQAVVFKSINNFIAEQGAIPGIQLGHAGRKASTRVPWKGRGKLGDHENPWQTLAPSPIPFSDDYALPREMDAKDINDLIIQFDKATKNSLEAGFQVVEIHMAHGYLLHEFLSPLSNKRTDVYGGSFDNRIRLPLQIAEKVRKRWPEKWPVFVRISCTDWVDGGWDLAQSIKFSSLLKDKGIDLIDCSSGGILPGIKIPASSGYQTDFAHRIKNETGIRTAAVGLITQPAQAEHIITTGQADAVMLAREMLRDPYWPLHAARTLGVDIEWPVRYERAKI